MKTTLHLIALVLVTLTAGSAFAGNDWKARLKAELPLLGHRNWIVVADAAYPLQTAPGIETRYVDAEQLDVVRAVLSALAAAKHVQPVIYTDAELKYVPEAAAPGIGAYRDALGKLLAGRAVQSQLHERIIGQLDEAGLTFKVLILKTRHRQPYTSVFFQLDCGYWSPDAEKELRHAMKQTSP